MREEEGTPKNPLTTYRYTYIINSPGVVLLDRRRLEQSTFVPTKEERGS